MADLIDRNILIAKMLLQHEDYRSQGATDMALGYGSAICDVRQAAAVDAEPVKQGVWYMGPDNVWTCSECGQTWEVVYGWEWRFNYCPHCGAKNVEV